MASGSIRIPRASIAVSVLRDPDYLELVGQEGGMAAFGVFTALVVAAREQNNNGDFSRLPMRVVAHLIGCTASQLENTLNIVGLACSEAGHPNGHWLVRSGDSLKIRQYRKWNQAGTHGGIRMGAGRPKNQVIQDGDSSDSSGNQEVIKQRTSVSVTVPVTEKKRRTALLKNDLDLGFTRWWAVYPRKVDKQEARRKYEKAIRRMTNTGHHFDNIVAILQIAVDALAPIARLASKKRRKFIPYPSTYLHRSRWEDPIEEWQQLLEETGGASDQRNLVG